MIKLGLMACCIASPSFFGIEIRKDLPGLTLGQIQERQRINEAKAEAFNKKYDSNAWRFDDAIKKERDAIFDEEYALKRAIEKKQK